jgi:site-specific recombinase XerD
MNDLLMDTLRDWEAQSNSSKDGLVFPLPEDGSTSDNVRRAWAIVLRAAKIKNFHWYDMRHDFASQLVMQGVDLNTVQKLMGHAKIKITLKYAHLALGNTEQLVKALDKKSSSRAAKSPETPKFER